MKEVGKLFLGIFLLVFLSSGVLAVEYGNCSVVSRNSCIAANGDNIVMGLSATTNAHAQLSNIGTYGYVLCCNFGSQTANLTCSGTNEILGLSATTNAHVESPYGSYTNSVCYSDLICGKYTSCPNNTLGILSISADTNAHVGTFNTYSTKICCGGSTVAKASCTLKSAVWSITDAIVGQGVRLVVTGSGAECNGKTVSFSVLEKDTFPTSYQNVGTNPVNVAFNGATATGLWVSEWQDDGVLGGNPEYVFNVSIVQNPNKYMLSTNELVITNEENYCVNSITTCQDYEDEQRCGSDMCGVAEGSSLPDIDCEADDVLCGCGWDSDTDQCDFEYMNITDESFCGDGNIDPGESCDGTNFGNLNRRCSSYNSAFTNGDLTCDGNCDISTSGCTGPTTGTCGDGKIKVGESCDGTNLSGKTCLNFDGFVSGVLKCDNHCTIDTRLCQNEENGGCGYGYTLCYNDFGYYCRLGSRCPDGELPPSNNNGTCDIGEGCLSEDCSTGGEKDTCGYDWYCLDGECSNVISPLSLNVTDLMGKCKITQIIEKDCNEEPVGYKILNWTGEWTGDKTGSAYTKCIAGGRSTVPCAAQVQLPFFDGFELVATVIVLATIYIIFLYKKKHHHKKKK